MNCLILICQLVLSRSTSICYATQIEKNQCHPSEMAIAQKLHLSHNNIAKHIKLLEKHGLIVTARTEIITKHGIKRTDKLLYTIMPKHEVREQFYERQLHELNRVTARQQVQKNLAEQVSARMPRVCPCAPL